MCAAAAAPWCPGQEPPARPGTPRSGGARVAAGPRRPRWAAQRRQCCRQDRMLRWTPGRYACSGSALSGLSRQGCPFSCLQMAAWPAAPGVIQASSGPGRHLNAGAALELPDAGRGHRLAGQRGEDQVGAVAKHLRARAEAEPVPADAPDCPSMHSSCRQRVSDGQGCQACAAGAPDAGGCRGRNASRGA